MKKYIMKGLMLLALVSTTALNSCLEKLPDDSIPTDQAIQTVEDCNQAVIGIYSAFKSSSLYSGTLTLCPDIQTDLVYAINGYSNQYGDIWRWEMRSDNSEVLAVYGTLYDIIASCNFLLDRIPEIRKTAYENDAIDKLDAYEGEARMARALCYSELIKLYCKSYESDDEAKKELGVSLVEHYNTDDLVPVRASLYDSYQFVLNDLDKAATLLTIDKDDTSTLYTNYYFSEYTVYALRARVALYMKKWNEAIEYASKVIDAKNSAGTKYYILSSATDLITSSYTAFEYMWAYDAATEIIWEIPFESTSYGGALGNVFLHFDYYNYRPDYVPAKWALDLYTTQDLRYNTYFYELQTAHTHGLKWPLLVKYYGNLTFLQSYYIPMVTMPKPFRLAEQYLIRAEAYANLSNYQEGAKDITTLRKARYNEYGSTSIFNESNWQQVIEEERVKELYMEGFRLQDLKRWHKGFTRTPQSQSISNGSSLEVAADDPLFVWPIPKHELESPGSNIQPNESN